MKSIFSVTHALVYIPFLLVAINLNAQKLPDKQKMEVLLPTNFKIDGMSTEWGNNFQAYDPATELAYTIANNDRFLYLIIQTGDLNVIERIAGGGITLTVANSVDKNKNAISFTYPIKKDNLIMTFRSPGDDNTVMNQQLEKKFKWITVSGIKELDTIAIYNEQGIEAAGRFDINKNYTAEFKIPIALIRDQINTGNITYFKISVNGGKAKLISNDDIKVLGGGPPTEATLKFMESIKNTRNNRTMLYNSTTYFSGEYKLVK